MGNSDSFRLLRHSNYAMTPLAKQDKKTIKKFSTFHKEYFSLESYTEPEAIENYYRKIKLSKAWLLHDINGTFIETFPGSIWSDYVPIVRINYEFSSDIDIQHVFSHLTDLNKIKLWDVYRKNIMRKQQENMITENYEVDFPFKKRVFRDVFEAKLIQKGFLIYYYPFDKTQGGKGKNFFYRWKVLKIDTKIVIHIIRHIDLGVNNSSSIEMLYAKFMYINIKSFLSVVLNITN